MKTVRGKAKKILMDLVYTTDPDEPIYTRHGVARSTFYHWKSDAVFRDALRQESERFEANLRHCRLASKRRRLEELERLYDSLPDSAPDKVLEHGGRQVLVERSNAATKAAILRDIKEEAEGARFRLGMSGDKQVSLTFVDWIRMAHVEASDQ